MLYYRKKKSNKNHILRILILLVIILVSSFVPSTNNIVSRVYSYVTKPIAETSSFISNNIRAFIDFSIGTKPNREMVDKLSKENQALRKEINDLKFVVSSSKALEEAYRFKSNNNKSIEANVIMVDNDIYFNTFKINRGSDDGVKNGDVIVSSYTDESKNINGALVGKVVSVDNKTATVSSIADEKFNITFVDLKSSTIGIVNERSKGNLKGYMLEKTEIKKDESVYTSGTGGKYPRGIYIGKIVSVTESDDRLRQIVEIDIPIDFSKLNQVFVIPNEER